MMFKYINYGDLDNVKKAIEEGYDINTIGKDENDKETPLITACSRFKVIKAIVEEIAKVPGVDPNIKDEVGFTALHYCTGMCGKAEIAKIVLGIPGVDVNAKSSNGETPLHVAVKRRNVELVRLLLEAPDIELDILDNFGFTPLVLAEEAIQTNANHCVNYDMIKEMLLEKGARFIFTPMSALECRNLEEFKKLDIEDINDMGAGGNTLLYTAVDLEYTEFVEYILSLPDVDVDLGDDREFTPLHRAAEDGNKEIVKMLMEAGANPELRNEDDDTPEMIAYDLETREILMGLNTEPSTIRREPNCVICFEPNPTCVTYPCGHCCFHVECNRNKIDKCPLCRKSILGKLRMI